MSLDTLYFLGISIGGGVLALFFSAGWGSYKDKKIPERRLLFRWFLAGLVACGLAAYAWIFGSGGNVGEAMKKITDVLELDSIAKIVSGGAALAAATTAASDSESGTHEEGDSVNVSSTRERAQSMAEMTVGMPSF
jgi:hypothetical protein